MTSKTDQRDEEIKRAIKVLKFLLSVDDIEVIKPTIEQIIESLEETTK